MVLAMYLLDNIFQQIFLVAYSILFGVMLQNISSLEGFQPFPWQQVFRSRIFRIRLLYSIVFLNVLPICYALGILVLLQEFNPSYWHLEYWWEHLEYGFLLFLTFLTGLGVFGFQRIYGRIAVWKPVYFAALRGIIEEQLGNSLFDMKASSLSIVYYLFPSFLLVIYRFAQPFISFLCLIAFFVAFAQVMLSQNHGK